MVPASEADVQGLSWLVEEIPPSTGGGGEGVVVVVV
jgi:hypothetical protein